MKKVITLLLAVASILWFAIIANASGTIMKVVNCDSSVALLDSGSINSNELARIPLGAEVEYTGFAEMGYYQVVYNGITGFVSARFLAVISTPEPIVTSTPIPEPTPTEDKSDGYAGYVGHNEDFEYWIRHWQCRIEKYIGNDTDVIIPPTIDGYPVTSIMDSAFAECGDLTSVSIPDSVASIGNEAFIRCGRLTTVSVSPGEADSNLTLAFGNSIEQNAFWGCKELTSVSIPNGVIELEAFVFRNCSKLERITLPDHLKKIGTGAFEGCTSLNSINIPDSLTVIDWKAFKDCSSLTSISIPDSVTWISDEAFRGCSGLTDVKISSSIDRIWKNVFGDCSSLTSVDIPNGVTRIDDFAFSDCTSLTNISIPNSVTIIWTGAFRNCISLTEVIIPDGVISIGGSAFWHCHGLETIILPASVQRIEDSAFKDTPLHTVYASANSFAWNWAVERGYEVLPIELVLNIEEIPDGGNTTGEVQDNKEEMGTGNTSSNLMNGGYIVEGGGEIYYSDGNAIWILDTVNKTRIKIIEGNYVDLNYWDGCLYAVMETKADGIVYTSSWNTHCVLSNRMYEDETYEDQVWSYTPVRITRDGRLTELAETLSANVSGIPEYKNLAIVNGSIYYLGSNNHGGSYQAGWFDDETGDYIEEAEYVYKTGISLYKMNIDGSGRVELISDAGNYASTFSTDGEHFVLLRGYENFLSMIDRSYLLFDANGENRRSFSNPSELWDYYPIIDGDDIFSVVYGGSGDDLPEIVRYSMRDGTEINLGVYCAGCPPIIQDDDLYCFTYMEPEDIYNGEDMEANKAAIVRIDKNGQNMKMIYSGGILFQYEDEYDYGWWLNANINIAGDGIFIAELPWYSDESDAHKALYRVDTMTGSLESIFSWSEGTTNDVVFDSRRERIESSRTISGKIEIVDSIDMLVNYSAQLRPIAIPDKNFDVLNTPVADFKYYSSDSSVVEVDLYGRITAIGEGEAIITIEDSNYGNAECVVSVQDREPIYSAVLFSHSDTSYRVNAQFWCEYLLPWTQYASRVFNLPDYSLDDYTSQMKKMEAWNEDLRLTPYDTTLVIMNTHGTTAQENQDLGIGFSTADKHNITYAKLKEDLTAIKGQKIVFLDSCYAGGFLESGNSKVNKNVTIEYGPSITESSGIYVLTASDTNETSRISRDEDNSVTLFTVLLWSHFVDGHNDVDGYLEELILNNVELTLSDLYQNAIANLESPDFKKQVNTDFNSSILVWPENSDFVVFRFGVQDTNTSIDTENVSIVASYSGSAYVEFERHDYSIYDSTKSFKSYYDLPVFKGETASIHRINQLLYDEYSHYVAGVEDLLSDEYVFWEWTDDENPFCDYIDVTEDLYLWSSQSDTETGVAYDNGDIISIVISGYWMMGGVNGQPIITHTFNLRSGEEMTLNELFNGVSEATLLSRVKSRIVTVLGDYVDENSDEFRTLSLGDIKFFISNSGELILCLENYQLGAATSIGPVIETGLYLGDLGVETEIEFSANHDQSQNDGDKWVRVRNQGDSVNVRTGPGLDFESIGILQYGTYLPYMGETQKDDRGVAWFKCSYQSRTAWVSEKYCGITE